MSAFRSSDDSRIASSVDPMPASAFGAETGAYFLRNTPAPATNPTPQRTMVPDAYCIENVTPIPFPSPASGFAVDAWNDQSPGAKVLNMDDRVMSGSRPPAPPVRQTLPQVSHTVAASAVGMPPSPAPARYPKRHSHSRRRGKGRGRKTANATEKEQTCETLEPQSFVHCMFTSTTDTAHDLLDWQGVTFPPDKTGYLERLLYILTKDNRLVYLSSVGFLIIALSWMFSQFGGRR